MSNDTLYPSDFDLRPGTDDCYKCSTCDVACPVSEVDDSFPGPKFQGPEQWRINRRDDHDVDSSIMECSNCMRCDSACPSSVPLSQMHNVARAEYVNEQGLSVRAIRNRILANYGLFARVLSKAPRLSNAIFRNPVTKWANETVLGITAEREFPAFATETFRAWWRNRGGPHVESEEKRVAYFHGDYANYNTPGVAKSLVSVYEHFGYEVAVPDQRCSGTPMFANGAMADAERVARFNVESLADYVEDGYDVVCSCTSCSMALRKEYPELFDFDGTLDVAAHTFDAVEYLRINEPLSSALADTRVNAGEFAYHAPCHARNQGLATQAVEVLSTVEGTTITDVGDSCSGISGTYGWKTEHYDASMAIGKEMFEHMKTVDSDAGMTECPTCAMQMEHGTGYEVTHPLEVLAGALE